MRLTTIWTLKGMSLHERIRRTAEWGAQAWAARLPRTVRYWAFVQVGAKAMRDDVVPEALFVDVLKRAEGDLR